MKILLNYQGVIVSTSDDIHPVKEFEGEWQLCAEIQKEAWFDTSQNIAYDKSLNVLEIDTIPKDIIPIRHCYSEEKGFYFNPEYIVPEVLRNEIIDAYTLQLIEEGMI